MTDKRMKRFNVLMPHELYDAIRDGRPPGETVVSELRRALRLYLLFRQGELDIKTKDGREVVLL